jgi:hypothetical protein
MREHAHDTNRLDAMLAGWLEGHAGKRGPSRADAVASAVITVRNDHVGQVEDLCRRWDMRVRRVEPCPGTPWTVMTVEGRALPVRGLARVARMIPRD